MNKKESIIILKNIIDGIRGRDCLTIHLHNGKHRDINKELLIENLSIVNEFAEKELCRELLNPVTKDLHEYKNYDFKFILIGIGNSPIG